MLNQILQISRNVFKIPYVQQCAFNALTRSWLQLKRKEFKVVILFFVVPFHITTSDSHYRLWTDETWHKVENKRSLFSLSRIFFFFLFWSKQCGHFTNQSMEAKRNKKWGKKTFNIQQVAFRFIIYINAYNWLQQASLAVFCFTNGFGTSLK